LLALTLAIVVSVAAGVGAERRWGERAQAGTRRALDGMLYLALPFITFFVVADTELTTGVGVGLVLGYAELALVGLAAWGAARRLLGLGRAATATLVIATVMANTGYLGIPLNAALLGRDDLGPAITFDAIVSGPMFYVVAFAIAAAFTTKGDPVAVRLRAFATRNPPLIAVLAALAAPDALASDALVDAAELAVIGLLPVGFFVLGVNLAAESDEGAFRFPPPLTPPILTVIGLRMLAAPALLLGLSALTVTVPDAYLVQAAMPVGINTLVVAHAYDLDLGLASGAIAWSTAIAVAAGLASLAL
jgi:predicted permease